MPISNTTPIGWLLQPQPLRMNEIEIAGILHVQYRASAVLHCIILYQNGHSGTKPPENVSTRNFLWIYPRDVRNYAVLFSLTKIA